jgi:signal transduction histidine kinase
MFSNKESTLEVVDLNEAIREVIALLLSERRRTWVVLPSMFADELPRIHGDCVQLQQVILNVLRNPHDAMVAVDDRPRTLVIRTEREAGNHVCVTVRDSSTGLDRKTSEILFDTFYTTKHGGMGIGLPVGRAIVKGHDDRHWAEPNDSPGTTVAFSIPLPRRQPKRPNSLAGTRDG